MPSATPDNRRAGAVVVPSAPVTGIAADPVEFGYWTVSADGNVYSFGDAASHGSAVADHPVAPIVGIVATRSGDGYWLVGRDGGIFTFGDAPFYGSGIDEDPSPVVGLAQTGFHTHPGYLVAHADGAVFLHVAGSSSRSTRRSSAWSLLSSASPRRRRRWATTSPPPTAL